MADSGFTIPTLADCVTSVQNDVNAALPGADSRIRRRATRALAMALGGVNWLLYKFALSISNEILPDLASAAGVRRWRKLWGLPDVAGERANGTTQFTGTPATVIPTATPVVRANGFVYVTLAPATISGGGIANVAIEAVDAGAAGNAETGVALYLSSPIAGVNTENLVQSPGLTGGVDDEGTESERDRVLDRMSDPPEGGAVSDFVQWTKEAVANTREVYVYPNTPVLGEVTIRFIVEPGPTGDPLLAIPSSAEVLAARLYVRGDPSASPFPYADAKSPAPLIGDRITIPEITAQGIAVEITNLDPDTPEVRAAVEDSLQAMMLQKARPGGTLKVSQFWGAIDAAPGEDSHELTGIDGGTPADVTIGADNFPYLSGVVYLP